MYIIYEVFTNDFFLPSAERKRTHAFSQNAKRSDITGFFTVQRGKLAVNLFLELNLAYHLSVF